MEKIRSDFYLAINDDQAVEKDPDDLETRFLRYAFYEQIPELFGVKDEALQDLTTVISLLKEHNCGTVCQNIQNDIADYILNTKAPNKLQRQQLQIFLKGSLVSSGVNLIMLPRQASDVHSMSSQSSRPAPDRRSRSFPAPA